MPPSLFTPSLKYSSISRSLIFLLWGNFDAFPYTYIYIRCILGAYIWYIVSILYSYI
nr:MAG TPA: hypothetical protein [Caudoviricetes sp.]